ncbi:MAG: helix-turn-helix domain-containing protein [Candidatus Cybelea sp.]
MARKHPRSYPLEFRLNVIELARAGRRVDELAAEFKLSVQTVRNWVKQADIDVGALLAPLTDSRVCACCWS